MKHTKSIKTNAARPNCTVPHGFQLMAKPAGPACNLRCAYCFYLEKKHFYKNNNLCRMPDEVLEAYTKEYIEAQPGPSVIFAWQGGEPTLAGIDFFQRALDFQKKYGKGKQLTNTLQTNGTNIDERWCAFLSKNNFLVGLSIDGPAMVHDTYRRDSAGKPTHEKVVRALNLMKRYGVEFNVVAAVNRRSSRFPLEVYQFFKEQGVQFVQFIPILERQADSAEKSMGIPLAAPLSLNQEGKGNAAATPWSVEPHKYGEFLIRIFQEWVKKDVGNIFVMNFEWSLAAWAGAIAGVCYLSPRCGLNLIIEHNGDIFSCDHYMYPAYRLGNILEGRLASIINSENQIAFGAQKETTLPGYCRSCKFLFACRGGCPKQRFLNSPDGEPGINYLCAGLKMFYESIDPYMKHMAKFINLGIPIKSIMDSAIR